MTLLVTGSSGLVGSAIKSLNPPNTFFADRSHADLSNLDDCMQLFDQVKPTQVIHLAALVGGIGGNMMKSAQFFQENIAINTNVLEAARIYKVENLISYMSTCVFPNKAEYPLTSEQLHLGPPHESNFAYAYAKRMLEVQTRAFRMQYGVNFNILIPSNIYGPHDNWNLHEGHVVPSLIHKIFKAKLDNTPLEVWGTGQPMREFIYSYDVAKISLELIANLNSQSPIIVSTEIEVTIRDLVNQIASDMDFTGEIRFNSEKPDGQLRKPSSSKEFQKILPDFKFTPLNEGIYETVKWFTNNYPNVRA